MLYLDVNWVAQLQNENQPTPSGLRPKRPTHFRDPTTYQRFYGLNSLTTVRLNEPWQAEEQALARVCGRFHLVPI